MPHQGWLPRCVICSEPVNLEESNTDERGQAVHENCYVELIKRRRVARKGGVPEWQSLISREWSRQRAEVRSAV